MLRDRSDYIWSKLNPRRFLKGKRTGIDDPRRNYVYNIVAKENPYSVLDVGCGPGIDCEGLRRLGLGIKYIGVDLASNFVHYDKQIFPKHEFLRASVKRLPFRNKIFDMVICKDLLEHLPNGYQSAIKEMLRVSQRKLIISWFIPPQKEFTKIGVTFPYNNLFHQVFVLVFTLIFGKIQFNIYNRRELVNFLSENGTMLTRVTKISMNFNRDPCEVWEICKRGETSKIEVYY